MGIDSSSQRQRSPLQFSSFIFGQVGFWDLRYHPLVRLLLFYASFFDSHVLFENEFFTFIGFPLFFRLIAYTNPFPLSFRFPSLTLILHNSMKTIVFHWYFQFQPEFLFRKSRVCDRFRMQFLLGMMNASFDMESLFRFEISTRESTRKLEVD